MPQDRTAWERKQMLELDAEIQKARVAAVPAPLEVKNVGYGADSESAPGRSFGFQSGGAPKPGRSFGFQNTGGKPINVGEPIKTEPLKSALSTPTTGVSGKDRWESLVKSRGLEDIDVMGRE